MVVIPITNKTVLVRHWFRWYRVQRGGLDWQPLKISPYQRPKTIAMIATKLQQKYPVKNLAK